MLALKLLLVPAFHRLHLRGGQALGTGRGGQPGWPASPPWVDWPDSFPAGAGARALAAWLAAVALLGWRPLLTVRCAGAGAGHAVHLPIPLPAAGLPPPALRAYRAPVCWSACWPAPALRSR
ncbi:hypothetical protein ACU4GD_35675 [Cupriavidus basilensis]